MMWKLIKSVLPILFLVLALTGCGHSTDSIAGKTYVYEKDGFGGEFTIQIKKDGTFQYYEGGLSSYIGTGDWTLKGDILLLTEGEGANSRKNYFRADGDQLIFIADGSSNFLYIEVADGERFTRSPTNGERRESP
jgi:hypothetical protein